MTWVACHTSGCENEGAPYTVEEGDEREHACPTCGTTMRQLAKEPTRGNIVSDPPTDAEIKRQQAGMEQTRELHAVRQQILDLIADGEDVPAALTKKRDKLLAKLEAK